MRADLNVGRNSASISCFLLISPDTKDLAGQVWRNCLDTDLKERQIVTLIFSHKSAYLNLKCSEDVFASCILEVSKKSSRF